ncbi:protein LEAD-SENSITIVE 1 isoform X3 [Ziziphus jujuba]|uniref:Protein LEAD-SENSITIVE 1 isoform X3 n=1 Tax=Ziziphus jujuba TaxID=326968 RepID=A0ABM3IFZ1_ZIZJJ|nr:protein LEAD-SENSITIVE 1 isoform X3 [Ziziphus jujuba]
MLSKKTKLRIRRVPSSRDRLQPVMVSKKKARSRTLLSSRERDKPIMNLIFTWSHNDTYFHPGWEAVVQSLNDPSIDLSERPLMDMGSGASASSNFSRWSCPTIWRMLLNMTWSVLSNKIQREELKPGDHVYTWRHSYSYAHHGIHIGEGKVIHFTRGGGKDRIIFSSSPSHTSKSTCALNSDQLRLDSVVTTSIDDFLLGGKLYRFEYGVNLLVFIAKTRGGTCTRAHSAPLEVVEHRCSYHLKNGFGDYHLFKNNCEDFAIYCKTGFKVADYNFSVGRSGQAASFIVAISAVICSIIRFPAVRITGLHFVIGYGIYSACRLASDVRVCHSAGEAADERLAEEESSGNFRYPGSVKFNSAFLILKRLAYHLLLVAIWWICCGVLQLTTECISYRLGWFILTATVCRLLFVPCDPENKKNK